MTEIILYHAPMSRSAIARWTLEEVGEPYRVETVDIRTGAGGRTPEYLKINPMGKVPAIKHGDVVVAENAAIAAYLGDAFPEKSLAPKIGDPTRGEYLRLLFWAANCIEPAMMQAHLKFDTQRGQAGWGDAELVFDVLAQTVARTPWLLGEDFSMADVIVGSGVAFGTQFGMMEKRPEYMDYLARIDARPARQRAQKLEMEAAQKAQEAAS